MKKKQKTEENQTAQKREVNNPVAKYKYKNLEITKWLNIDPQTGNEWYNFLFKYSYKDKNTDEWHDYSARFSEGELSKIRDLFNMAVQKEMEANLIR